MKIMKMMWARSTPGDSEPQKRTKVMAVGRHQRSDVSSSGQVGGSQWTVSPRQRLSLEVSDEGNVRHQSSMSAIARS
jgi:hypothetical protein